MRANREAAEAVIIPRIGNAALAQRLRARDSAGDLINDPMNCRFG
jgi:hypothetical protein